MTVEELRQILAKLPDTAVLERNAVGNLVVLVNTDGKELAIGYIDVKFGGYHTFTDDDEED